MKILTILKDKALNISNLRDAISRFFSRGRKKECFTVGIIILLFLIIILKIRGVI